MKNRIKSLCLPLILLTLITACSEEGKTSASSRASMVSDNEIRIKLPEPRATGDISLEESLSKRRSIRDYSTKPLSLKQVSQMLWAAQGITEDWGGRTAPSAGALYPLEVYLVAGNVQSLSPGVYRYQPKDHELIMITSGDLRKELFAASLRQNAVRDSAVNFIYTAVFQRTTRKYGSRGIHYVYMEAGHAAQNMCLQATAMNLGAVTIGAFDEDDVEDILNLPKNELPLYIISAGHKS